MNLAFTDAVNRAVELTMLELTKRTIAERESELRELRQLLAKLQRAQIRKPRRVREKIGPRNGSMVSSIAGYLKRSKKPLDAGAISERLAKDGRKVPSRMISAALRPYIKDGRLFAKAGNGYTLKS